MACSRVDATKHEGRGDSLKGRPCTSRLSCRYNFGGGLRDAMMLRAATGTTASRRHARCTRGHTSARSAVQSGQAIRTRTAGAAFLGIVTRI